MTRSFFTKWINTLLGRAMPKLIDMSRVRDARCGRIHVKGEVTPWVGIPNVQSFNISLGKWDVFFAAFGIRKRFGTTLELVPYKNRTINRYVTHQIIRLADARKRKPSLYFQIAYFTMKRSNSFRVLAFNHVYPNWHRNQALSFIVNTNRKVSELINDSIVTMKYRRVYIPKSSTQYRPLGVPTAEWRIYLHMLSNCLTFYLAPRLTNLHGYLPGKSIITAWKQILSGLHKKKYIYEWDFKGFFDTVNIREVSRLLSKAKVPTDWVEFLEAVNRSAIQLEKEDLVDETYHRDQMHLTQIARQGLASLFMAEGADQQMAEEVSKYFFSGRLGSQGVPQGAATSPILSNLVMNEWYKICKKRGVTLVSYADDSVGFSDHPIEIKEPTHLGIKFNQEKSGYVQYDKEMLKPLKFLGLEFSKDLFRAHTRKGSRLGVLPKDVLLGELFYELHDKCQALTVEEALKLIDEASDTFRSYPEPQLSFNKIFTSKLAGFIVSRLYAGKWNLDDLHQDFNMSFVKSSWMGSKLCRHELDIFNSSSFASLSLANIFRYCFGRYRKIRGVKLKKVLKFSSLKTL